MRVWDKFLTERDKAVYEASGFGARGGFGARPAVLIVDVAYAFTGDRDLPILESLETWRSSCGHAAWAAIPPTQKLLAAARANRIPVFFSTGVDGRPDGFGRGGRATKNRRSTENLPAGEARKPERGNDIVRDIAPQPHEIVIEKMKPSPFNSTPLNGFLIDLEIDTLLVTGTTTSGCVRAAVTDAFSLNYKVTVVEECTFDRFESSHALTLFDMQAKYCDVVGVDEAVAYLGRIAPGLFDDKIAFPKTRETVSI
jgi:maleamate amidohydrolase